MPDLIFRVDTHTTRAFHGHPVTVCILEKPRDRPWMREVSRAMNTSEAAFLLSRGPNRFDLRTMSGGIEVEMAASASLAAAHVLFTHSLADPRRSIAFFTRMGSIPAMLENGIYEINFPALVLEELLDPPDEILQGVDPAPEFAGRRGDDYFVQVASEDQLRDIRPDFNLLRAMGMQSLIVTSVATFTTSQDFVSRTFHIPTPLEDPIASYAPFLLAPFWFLRLGKSPLRSLQRSRTFSRTTDHALRLAIDTDRVTLLGEAVTVFEGELKI
ncbi:MAG TPA: PhzF family phenazine biosynthesis protein [Candidatus Kapabacteria bacterium]|nr:PhzF family phenazine biosynthesis protein [Candidatus Kapabacteria bacterium]